MVTRAPRPVEFVIADMEAKGVYTYEQIERVRNVLESAERTRTMPRPGDAPMTVGVFQYA